MKTRFCYLWLLLSITALPLSEAIELPASGELAIPANGGFESWVEVRPGSDGLVSGWKLDVPPKKPESWSLNNAYPGELHLSREGPHSGQHFARIAASAGRQAHLFQTCTGLKAGVWYQVSAWTRGGPVTLCCYEYGKAKFLGTVSIAQATAPSSAWRLVSGYYRPTASEYERSAVAVTVAPGATVDVDDVTIAPAQIPGLPDGTADITWETDSARLTVSSSGAIREFRSKPSGADYAPGPVPFGVFSATRNGVVTPLHELTREGDLLRARFVDPEVKAIFRVTARARHLLFEVTGIEPADVEQLTWAFPIRRLAKVGSAFNATYDDQFGASLFGTTVNVFNRPAAQGPDVFSMGGGCTRKHGIAGAKFALVAAPANQFASAIMEAEKANGLPCPLLGGEWARQSRAVRKSYLFMVDAAESNIDRSIEYAKLGGFGTIIFLKDNWLATHGHYQINQRNFPGGLPSLKRAVDKIHGAGLEAGVHVFGPSISPNDPYVTPKPDNRLAGIDCPPLAEAVDAKSATLTLSGEPGLPPKKPRSAAFPGYFLRVGDEIVRYQAVEQGPPFRFTGCQRGALGTQAAAHPAGTAVLGLLSLWGYFLVDPDSTLADEVVRNFGEVFNACDFDMAYFDASDGFSDAYGDRWYYLNKMHLGYYSQFRKDVLYQTSNGTGTDICWHLIPRSASADGHGDLKGYLDERWPGILGMTDNWTRPDVGWYYIFTEVRPDQIEYVCSKVLGIDGSISIETSQDALEKHVYGRRMMDMLGRYERCRLAGRFPEPARALLRETGQDFRLVGKPGAETLYRAVYETPRVVEELDGRQNVWNIRNDQPQPSWLAVEITRGTRSMPTSDYNQPGAKTVEAFEDARAFQAPQPGSSNGVVQTFSVSGEQPGDRTNSAIWKVENRGDHGGWASMERRLDTPANLSNSKALAVWIHGDAGGEQLRIELRDAASKTAVWTVPIGFHGWRLCSYPLSSPTPNLDWSRIMGMQFRIQSLRAGMAAQVGLDDLRALPEVHPAPAAITPIIKLNGKSMALGTGLAPDRGITADAFEGVQLWSGGMRPAEPLGGDPALLRLQPGENRISFSAAPEAGYPGDVTVVLSQLWPL